MYPRILKISFKIADFSLKMSYDSGPFVDLGDQFVQYQ